MLDKAREEVCLNRQDYMLIIHGNPNIKLYNVAH